MPTINNDVRLNNVRPFLRVQPFLCPFEFFPRVQFSCRYFYTESTSKGLNSWPNIISEWRFIVVFFVVCDAMHMYLALQIYCWKFFPPLDVARSRSESGELSRNGYLPSTMSSENGKWPSWINSDGFEYQKCAGITFSHSFWVFTWILWLWYRLRAETQRGELMSANYDWWYEPRCASWLK